MRVEIAVATAWAATALAVAVAIYFTKDANCLWAMLIPAMIGTASSGGQNECDKK